MRERERERERETLTQTRERENPINTFTQKRENNKGSETEESQICNGHHNRTSFLRINSIVVQTRKFKRSGILVLFFFTLKIF